MAIQKPVRTVQVGRAVTAVEEMSSKNTDRDKTPTELDIFRDTPIRYLGYANEVGESLRALVHVRVVRLSYVISCSYVCADACSKGMKTAKLPWSCDSEKTRKVTESVVDTLVWQGLASVAVPGFTINRICWLTGQVLQRSTSLPAQTRKWIMLATGLAAIPFIIKPIDHATDWTLDRSLRKLPGMSHEDS